MGSNTLTQLSEQTNWGWACLCTCLHKNSVIWVFYCVRELFVLIFIRYIGNSHRTPTHKTLSNTKLSTRTIICLWVFCLFMLVPAFYSYLPFQTQTFFLCQPSGFSMDALGKGSCTLATAWPSFSQSSHHHSHDAKGCYALYTKTQHLVCAAPLLA